MVETNGVTKISPPHELSHVAVGRLKHECAGDYDRLVQEFFNGNEREEWQGCRHPGRQAEWLGVRICLKQMLFDNGAATHPRELAIKKNDRGRPYVFAQSSGTPITGDCSLSHADKWCVAAWTSRPGEKIGVDVERISERLHRAAGAFVSPVDRGCQERSQTEQLAIWWSLKEAGSKVLGMGLGAGFAEISCVEVGGGMHRLSHRSGQSMIGWHTRFDDFIVALCACGAVA
jgi:phosphopantetheinyl transferase